DVLKNAVKCIAELITVQAEQNIDFKDIETVMKNSGPAMLGLATASGPNRIKEVVDGALSCPLLDENMITNAKNFLFFISYGEDEPLKMSELAQIVKEFERVKSPNTDVIWGRAKDKNLGDKVKLSVIVTNYQTSEKITEVNVVSEIEKDDESGIHVSTEKQEGATFINVESSLQPEEPVTVMPAPVFEEEKEEIVSTPFTGDLFSGKMEEEPMPVTVAAVPTSETEHRKTIIRKGESVLSQLGMTKGIQYDDNESFDRIDNIPAIERANRLRAQNNETSRSSLFEQSDANNLYRQRAD
ncbi:hypothetical protein LJC67_00505, partial [Bacteroidales bacterium OttesenSCG-928-A14]|nr:hypothetical protein [Bacteroidales bacterium OttesenSCG-928-A14]